MLGSEEKAPLGAKVTIAVLLALALTYVFYMDYTVSTSEARYTVAEILEKYNDSKGFGKTVVYNVDSKEIRAHCFSPECKNAAVGERFVLKYYIDDPMFFEILFDHPITNEVDVPIDGWKQVPNY